MHGVGTRAVITIGNRPSTGAKTVGVLLRGPSDVSLGSAKASYKTACFGIDWLTWLMVRHEPEH
ncbi:hypothetical protein ROLI_043340 [Roseobacter fucihabitans]|uniref:CinA C-terminal domain-containing protein n=1 Tax=Roseobacter fucihabitans TaxID=1537242 RepID=A0ABZ2C0Z9_9RHOB|nr:hypothetical protein [Roseobacter litoralis]MBC6964102.1 hypothetical protein [Roseobacter litoralis]